MPVARFKTLTALDEQFNLEDDYNTGANEGWVQKYKITCSNGDVVHRAITAPRLDPLADPNRFLFHVPSAAVICFDEGGPDDLLLHRVTEKFMQMEHRGFFDDLEEGGVFEIQDGEYYADLSVLKAVILWLSNSRPNGGAMRVANMTAGREWAARYCEKKKKCHPKLEAAARYSHAVALQLRAEREAEEARTDALLSAVADAGDRPTSSGESGATVTPFDEATPRRSARKAVPTKKLNVSGRKGDALNKRKKSRTKTTKRATGVKSVDDFGVEMRTFKTRVGTLNGSWTRVAANLRHAAKSYHLFLKQYDLVAKEADRYLKYETHPKGAAAMQKFADGGDGDVRRTRPLFAEDAEWRRRYGTVQAVQALAGAVLETCVEDCPLLERPDGGITCPGCMTAHPEAR